MWLVLEVEVYMLNVRIIHIFHQGAARALLSHTDLSAEEIGLKAMKIAADKCIYTNHNFTSEKIIWWSFNCTFIKRNLK